MPALQVRLSDDEYAKCKEAAKIAGVSMSEWVRSRLFDNQPPPIPAPSKKPRPLPPRVPVNTDGVIVAPARKVPLPPVRRPAVVTPFVLDATTEPPVTIAIRPDGFETGEEVTITFDDFEDVPKQVEVKPSKPIPPDFDEDPLGSPEKTLEKVRDKAMDDLMEKSRPSTIGWTGATSKPTFKRHPKCETEKCERRKHGPCCPLCIQLNAKRF